MKKHTFSLLIISILFLSACTVADDKNATESIVISDIYTAAAITIAAQNSIVTPTVFVTPTSIPVTGTASPVYVSSSPTQQSTASYSSYSTAYGCYDAVYVSDVTIPDGTVLSPGETFTKTWQFQNTGSCAWDEDFLLTFISGEDMDGTDTTIDTSVAVGSSGSLSVSLVAPDTAGSYTGYWKLATADGVGFGQSVYVLIVVSGNTPTSTLTATATATSTTESTATSVPTSTYTPVPDDSSTSDDPNEETE